MLYVLVKVISNSREQEYLVEADSMREIISKTKEQYEKDGFENPICILNLLTEERKNRLLQLQSGSSRNGNVFERIKTLFKTYVGIKPIKIIK